MKIYVDSYPESPRDCLFSKFEPRGDFYVCTLREYIEEADDRDTGYKPNCICKHVNKCEKLCLCKSDLEHNLEKGLYTYKNF